jgi:hypothetical protein
MCPPQPKQAFDPSQTRTEFLTRCIVSMQPVPLNGLHLKQNEFSSIFFQQELFFHKLSRCICVYLPIQEPISASKVELNHNMYPNSPTVFWSNRPSRHIHAFRMSRSASGAPPVTCRSPPQSCSATDGSLVWRQTRPTCSALGGRQGGPM